jgi:hypothetical protein
MWRKLHDLQLQQRQQQQQQQQQQRQLEAHGTHTICFMEQCKSSESCLRDRLDAHSLV